MGIAGGPRPEWERRISLGQLIVCSTVPFLGTVGDLCSSRMICPTLGAKCALACCILAAYLSTSSTYIFIINPCHILKKAINGVAVNISGKTDQGALLDH